MTILYLILIAVISYALGNCSPCMLLSRYVFRKHVRRYSRPNCAITSFYRDFGALGAAAFVLSDIIRAAVAVGIGGGLMGIAGYAPVGRAFAAFCLLLGQFWPFLFLYKSSKSSNMVCAAAAAFFIDWRVGLLCLISYVIIVAFTGYASVGAIASSILAAIFMWLFEFSGLDGAVVLCCAMLVLVKHAQNLLRVVGGTEPKIFELSRLTHRKRPIEEEN